MKKLLIILALLPVLAFCQTIYDVNRVRSNKITLPQDSLLYFGASSLSFDGTTTNFSHPIKMSGANAVYFNTTGYYIAGTSNLMIYNSPGSHYFRFAGTYKYQMNATVFAPYTSLLCDLGSTTVKWNKFYSLNITDTVGFTKFYSDILYVDTFWDDLTFPATTTKVGATDKPDFDYSDIALMFPKNDSTEATYYIVQMPHKWDGTDIYPHVHYIQDAAGDTAKFVLKYFWTDMGETYSTQTRVEASNHTVFAYTSGKMHQLASFPAISATGHTASSVLQIQLFRWDNLGTGDVPVLDFDIHYAIDKPGSDNTMP